MEHSVEQPVVTVGCVERKNQRNALCKHSDNKNINFSFVSKTSYCYLDCTLYSEQISYLFKFIGFSKRRYTNYK